MISLALFHPASLIQPPPLRGTSFHRKEGVSTRAPSLGRGCRAQRGGVGFLFLRRSRLLFAFPLGKGVVSRKAASSYRSLPHWGRGTAQRRSGALVNDALETIFFALFHPARTLSGSLRSPPSPRGEGFAGGIVFPHTHLLHTHLLCKGTPDHANTPNQKSRRDRPACV